MDTDIDMLISAKRGRRLSMLHLQRFDVYSLDAFEYCLLAALFDFSKALTCCGRTLGRGTRSFDFSVNSIPSQLPLPPMALT